MLLRWPGGKSKLAGWIQSHEPKGYTHRYIAFAGSLGELWTWPYEGISETVNDVNYDLINFYNVLRNREMRKDFLEYVTLTPLSKVEFENANVRALHDPVKNAISFFIRNRMSRQGLGRDYVTPTTRIRREMNEQVSAWLSSVDGLADFVQRLLRVELECMDALEFIMKYDHPNAFFYLDPPYLHDTRVAKDAYGAYEMTAYDHVCLLSLLASPEFVWKEDVALTQRIRNLLNYRLKGRFLLSGYDNPMYDQVSQACNWRRTTREVTLDSSSKSTKERKTECLWYNYG